jgi:hypothetical protein
VNTFISQSAIVGTDIATSTLAHPLSSMIINRFNFSRSFNNRNNFSPI